MIASITKAQKVNRKRKNVNICKAKTELKCAAWCGE